MKQEVHHNPSTNEINIITRVLEIDIARMNENEKLFNAVMGEVNRRIVEKVADIIEPQVVAHLMKKVDIEQLVNDATTAQIRAALFPKPLNPSSV